MSQENASNKPLIRYVNRQQMSWRAVDVETLIGEAIVGAEESWNFAMRGSKASWACASFTCVACESAGGNAVGLPHLQSATVDPFAKTPNRASHGLDSENVETRQKRRKH